MAEPKKQSRSWLFFVLALARPVAKMNLSGGG